MARSGAKRGRNREAVGLPRIGRQILAGTRLDLGRKGRLEPESGRVVAESEPHLAEIMPISAKGAPDLVETGRSWPDNSQMWTNPSEFRPNSGSIRPSLVDIGRKSATIKRKLGAAGPNSAQFYQIGGDISAKRGRDTAKVGPHLADIVRI